MFGGTPKWRCNSSRLPPTCLSDTIWLVLVQRPVPGASFKRSVDSWKFDGLSWPWVKNQIVPPVSIPIPTKIGSKMGGEPNPKVVPLVLTHSQLVSCL